MKIKKFNEELTDYSDYKEYDEYSNLNIDIINNWNTDISEVNKFISNFRHEIRQYSDFIRDYVVSSIRGSIIIPNDIKIKYDNDELKCFFYDTYTGGLIQTSNIKYFKNISEIAETDQALFMELYEKYIKKYNAPYMDVFGKDEFKHLLTSKKYNL